ncbi:MAG: ketoacyl-ACP synthase III [Succinivibrionaceae bacterium]|nr:ketoacyl-ACP synthase III [Succinivibrionaceae bacterium]
MHTKILGTGGYLPSKVRTNADLERMVETSDQWIMERTGISERRVAAPGETTATMGAIAARAALESSGLAPQDIDAVLVATTSSSCAYPSTACEIARELGIANAAAMDLAAACAGFSYAYATAHAMIVAGQARHVLIVGVDICSRICNPHDRTTIILFGDGAGACVLAASDEPGTLAVRLSSDPTCGDLLRLPNPARDEPPSEDNYLLMRGSEVFKHAVVILSRLVDETLAAGGLAPSELDFLVPHQANLRIISATARRLGLDMSQVIVTIGKQGNTSSASVPLALDEGVRSGRIKRGMNILLESFGGGLTWGSALIRF